MQFLLCNSRKFITNQMKVLLIVSMLHGMEKHPGKTYGVEKDFMTI